MILRCIAGLLGLALTCSSALADEVLYCVDTAATGFVWKNGKATPTPLDPERFTVKVISDHERTITQTVGDIAGLVWEYVCRDSGGGATACDTKYGGGTPWVFFLDAYTRARLQSPPVGGGFPNMFIAYGTCSKF